MDTETPGAPVDNDTVKIRLKLPEGEIEAEGPDALVRAHLQEFKAYLADKRPPSTPAPAAETQPDLFYQADLATKSLTLRILPSTDQGVTQQVANALLLVLNGFREALATPEVPVLSASEAIRQSGLVQVKRLSNAFTNLQTEGLALKVGSGKGTRYQLTAKGQTAAQELIQTTLRRAGLS